MRNRRSALKCAALCTATVLAVMAGGSISAFAANKELKIGFVGVTSGPAAAWGTSNVRSMQTLAAMINDSGGVKIGDDTYNIKIVTFDDQKDPKRAIAGMEKMAQEGIHYVVGPNVDDGAAAVRPVAEKNGHHLLPLRFPEGALHQAGLQRVLGMVANYQSGPAIYKYLKEKKGVKTVAFVAANESDPLSQRDSGVAAAKALGLDVVADKDTYENDTRDFTPVLTPIVKLKPDLLVLSGVAPGERAAADPVGAGARLQGHDLDRNRAGRQGARRKAPAISPTASSRSAAPRRRRSVPRPWTSSSRATPRCSANTTTSRTPRSTRSQYIVDTLKADPKAIDNVDEFKKTIDNFSAPNPYLKGNEVLKYVGMTSFGQKRQIAVPLVVNEYQDGKFKTLFVGTSISRAARPPFSARARLRP